MKSIIVQQKLTTERKINPSINFIDEPQNLLLEKTSNKTSREGRHVKG